MVEFKGGTLAVSNLLVIATDVDMNSGNVHAPEGSVQIKGTVTSGSAVTAKENVLVEGVLENADVTAGGDVVVAFGILMDQAGAAIRAGGGVRAKFIRNATIQAKGDVVVEQDIVNSSIKADGRVLATGEKGSVRGGAIECSGLETTELGSDAGVPTTVTIAVAMPGLAEADARREQIRTRQAELDRLIGTDDPRNTLLLAPEEDRLLLGALLKLRARLNDELTELDEQRDNMLEAQGKELAKHRVVARKVVHQGTTINIANRSITLKKPEQASQFRWDWEKRGIGVSSA
jgi:uncharacterized protein (DUF342 family)